MILITGINGFVGSHIARLLVKNGQSVRGLIRKTGKEANLADIKSKIELIEGDIRDIRALRRAFEGVDICYHAAALVKVGRFTAEEYFSTNLQGTMGVCEEAINAGVKRFIYTSTCETLRRHPSPLPSPPRGEGDSNAYHDMVGGYGRSKFLAEEHVRARASSGLPAVIVNPTAVMGPGDINITAPGYLILQYLKGRIPAWFETGFNIVDVRDVAAGHCLAAEKGRIGERYSLGNHNVQLTKLFKLLKEVSGRRPLSIRLPYRLILAASYLVGSATVSVERVRSSRHPFFISSSKAATELGWRPDFDLQTTLKDAWNWYRSSTV